ncbi:MAG TPA: hypothetical protein EYP57_06435 [Thermodesulfobacteriaceae bacterium]|nr:hypothetical protein [Thermodesulfobacteriaceae bacterium]
MGVVGSEKNDKSAKKRFEKKLICDKINRILPEGSRIRNIRFVLGNVDRTRSRCSSRKRNHGVSRQPVSRPIPDDVLNVVEQMVEPVSDPGLRDALKKLYLKHLEKRDGS